MNSKTSKQKNPVDWRNTLYQFHEVAVEKFSLRPFEISIFTALLSGVKSSGVIAKSNDELMRKSRIANKRTFIKAKNRLIETGLIRIIEEGHYKGGKTIYKIKLLGRPKNQQIENTEKSDKETATQRGAKLPLT